MEKTIYYLGGGTCCGKSTLAARLAEKNGLQYYRQDDFLEEYLHAMAQQGDEVAARAAAYSNEEMWMRDPVQMCTEQAKLYEGMYPHTQNAIQALAQTGGVVGEGAGLLPHLLHADGVAPACFVCMVPSETFRLAQYKGREWVRYYLADTSSPDRCFANWMQRDALHSQMVASKAKSLGYTVLLVDGTRSIEENLAFVEGHFGL